MCRQDKSIIFEYNFVWPFTIFQSVASNKPTLYFGFKKETERTKTLGMIPAASLTCHVTLRLVELRAFPRTSVGGAEGGSCAVTNRTSELGVELPTALAAVTRTRYDCAGSSPRM